MKNFRSFLLIFILPLAVCASSREPMRWSSNGAVVAEGATLKTELQNAYTALETKSGLYLGGFKIDTEGVNYPFVVFVSQDLKELKSWPMESSVSHFFQFRGKVHALTAEGQALKENSIGWARTELAFKPESIVVWSGEDIIACNPSPLLMTDKRKGGCYSLFKGWQLNANWQGIEPKICDGKLVVLETLRGGLHIRRVDLTSGTILATQKVGGAVTDLCAMKF